ncbi:unnamed protein product, partial [Prorocentrum cordatum]
REGADPWARVAAATKEADSLEAALTQLEPERAAAEEEASAGEAAAGEAEMSLTSCSAEMLDEYAAEHQRLLALEAELGAAREAHGARRAENLGLCRRSLALDCEASHCREQVAEAQTVLDDYVSSQGSLAARISERLEECERLRLSAQE